MTASPAARLTFLLSALIAPALFAQDKTPKPEIDAKPSEVLPDRPDVELDNPKELLGAEYESRGHGIAIRPPKNLSPVRRLGAKEFIEFDDDAKGWELKLSKIQLDKPGSLTEVRDPDGTLHPGMLQFTVKRLKEEIPDAEILRNEVVTLRDGEAGVLALRFTKNQKPVLAQQAIIQKTDQMYYLIALTTPGAPKGAKKEDATTIALEKRAVDTFREMLDSVKLIDRGDIRADQDKRLFSTRAMLVNLSADKVRTALARQRWTRITKKVGNKDFKDIGYSYFEETTMLKGAQEGIEVRIRSRLLPGNDVQIDSGSILYNSMDLRHEDWSSLSARANIKARATQKNYLPPQIAEFGVSDRRTIPGHGDTYSLQVTFDSKTDKVDPVARELPPFYMPQAMAHLLPRLVPTNEPKAFMFAQYVPETRELMLRYIDVLKITKLDQFNGQAGVRVVPIEDRLGIEGPVTTHYISLDGKWLGSVTKEDGITVVPSDEETLMRIWKDAILKAPDVPQGPAGAKPQAAPEAEGPTSKTPDKNAAPAGSRKAARQKIGVGNGTN